MKCKRCNTIHSKIENCPTCNEPSPTAIKKLHLVIERTKREWYRRLTIYVTEFDNRKSKIGSITDFYTVIYLITRLLNKFPKLVEIEDKSNEL